MPQNILQQIFECVTTETGRSFPSTFTYKYYTIYKGMYRRTTITKYRNQTFCCKPYIAVYYLVEYILTNKNRRQLIYSCP